MSFYRTILAAVAAVAIATPVFADDTANTTSNSTTTATTPAADTTAATTPAAASTTTTTTDTATTTTTDAKVNLNKATVKELAKVKGLNASKAKAIVAYRKKHGDFKSTDDLANVKGFKKIKPDALKSISDQLSVE